MADSLVTGFDGSSLCLDYPGTSLVLMTTPCPYALWDYENVSTVRGDLTFSGGEITLTCNTAGTYLAYGFFDLLMLLTEVGGTKKLTLTFNLTKTPGAHIFARCSSEPLIGVYGDYQSVLVESDGETTGTMNVPWYRYRLTCYLELSFVYPYSAVGDWAKVAITLS